MLYTYLVSGRAASETRFPAPGYAQHRPGTGLQPKTLSAGNADTT